MKKTILVVLILLVNSELHAAMNFYSDGVIQDGDSYQDVDSWNNATVDMTGGEVTRGFISRNFSTVNFSGGRVWLMRSYDNSTINVTGGRVDKLSSRDNSTINFSGGELVDNVLYSMEQSIINFHDGEVSLLYCVDNSTINFTGGQVSRLLGISGPTTINISGGRITRHLMGGQGGCVINIYGYNLHATYSSVTGIWENGTPFEINLANNLGVRTYDHIVLHETYNPVVGLEITGPLEVNKDSLVQYTAMAYYEDGSTRDVTSEAVWIAEPNDYGSFNASGLFAATDMHLAAEIIIRAQYTENEVTVEDELIISYTPSPPGYYVNKALADKAEALELIDYAMENEQKTAEALEQVLDIGDYGDLKKGDIVQAKQKIHSALQHQQQSKDTLEKSIAELGGVLETLGYEPPPPPPLPAPMAHWTFDEGSGSTAGDSVGTNDGTLNGDLNWVTGKIGSWALEFDGVGDYVALPLNDPIWLSQNDFTVSCWAYFNGDASAPEEALVDLNCGRSSAASNRLGYMVDRLPAGTIRFYMITGSGTLDELVSASVIPGGDWYHIVAVREGTTQSIYINGSLDNDRTCSAGAIDFTGAYDDDTVNIGGFTSQGNSIQQTLNGQLDDVRIYNVALTAGEIQQLYEAGL